MDFPGETRKRKLSLATACKPIDIEWENLTVATVTEKKVTVNGVVNVTMEKKAILNDISGSIKHGKFTAIMGPSGCGKTTLLNFLAGRIDNKLDITGDFRVNSQSVPDIDFISNLVAFVQQDDILFSTMTPRGNITPDQQLKFLEIFSFAADLRLNLPKEKKAERVEQVIEELDIVKCANTRVGNSEFRGLSGGERKRASIGVDLVTNPGLIFLDEPTTGLDSTTAQNVLEVLGRLARSGRNVVSTIHQPSSEIFERFDNLILIVRGNIIYQGLASESVDYFGRIGFPCPKLTNPADFFMKLMNESGLVLDELTHSRRKTITINEAAVEAKLQKRINNFVTSYKNSPMYDQFRENIWQEPIENKTKYHVSKIYQFILILTRAFKNEIRNPHNFKTTLIQIIFVVFLVDTLYYQIKDDNSSVQNRTGVLFLLSSMSGFTAITGSIGTFSQEKPVFLRERLTKSYSAGAYFCGRSLSELPFLIFYPILLMSLVYWVIGLQDDLPKFYLAVGFHILTWLAGSGFGLFLSTLIPRLEFALAIVPALIVPFLILTGFFVKDSKISWYWKPVEYLSIFKWSFQGTAKNEYTGLTLSCLKPLCTTYGQTNCLTPCDPKTDDSCILPCGNPLDDFPDSIYTSVIMLIIISIAMRIAAYLALIYISTPKKAKMIKPPASSYRPPSDLGANSNNTSRDHVAINTSRSDDPSQDIIVEHADPN